MNLSIKEITKKLHISRSKLYVIFGRLEIKTQKKDNKVYITKSQFKEIEKYLKDTDNNKTADTISSQEVDFYEKRIKSLEEELKSERQEKAQITLLLGKAQGEAEAYKLQSQKLLEEKNTIQYPEEKKGFFARLFGK